MHDAGQDRCGNQMEQGAKKEDLLDMR